MKNGQVEYPRPFETLNDQMKIQYHVDDDGNIFAETNADKIEIDEDNDIVMRDDSQFVILSKDDIREKFNNKLESLGQQLAKQLEVISKIHMRIN